MSVLKKSGTLLIALVSIIGLTACEDDAEDAGEEIDELITDAGNAVEDACENAKEGVGTKDEDC